MADEFLSKTVVDHKTTSHRQVALPSVVTASFNSQDTDKHKVRIDARGKGKINVHVVNDTDTNLPVTIYGMQTEDGDIGDTGVTQADTFTANTVSSNYKSVTDYFPWYLVSMEFASAPTDGVPQTITMYANLSSN